MHRIKIRYRPSQRMTNRVEENTLSKLLKARNNGRARLVLDSSRLWGGGQTGLCKISQLLGQIEGPLHLLQNILDFVLC